MSESISEQNNSLKLDHCKKNNEHKFYCCVSNEVRTGARTLLNLDQVVSPSLCQFSDLVWNLKVSLDVTYTKE